MGLVTAPSEDEFRALARSSPWRFSTLHFTHRRADGRVAEAWLSRPGRLRVVDEHGTHVESGVPYSKAALVSEGSSPPWTPSPPQAHRPILRPDGLVASRPSAVDVDYDDPMWQSFDWVAMLDPVELSTGTVLSDLAQTARLGRSTWWAVARATEGYGPRCSCCPLLWGEVSERLLHGEAGQAYAAPPSSTYPDAWLVGLDVQTGVVVSCEPIGGTRHDLGFTMHILAVGDPMDDALFRAPDRPLP